MLGEPQLSLFLNVITVYFVCGCFDGASDAFPYYLLVANEI